jgi:hypothetical protein
MFAATHTIPAFPGACRLVEKEALVIRLWAMGGVLFGDKPTGDKFCRDRQTPLYVSNSHYGFAPSEAAQF